MIESIIETIMDTIKKVVPDTVKQKELEVLLFKIAEENETKAIESRTKLTLAEFKSETFLNRNWRSLTMLSFVAIIVYDYLICPLLNSVGLNILSKDIPTELWFGLNTALGAGLGLHSLERMFKTFNQKRGKNVER